MGVLLQASDAAEVGVVWVLLAPAAAGKPLLSRGAHLKTWISDVSSSKSLGPQ